MRWEEERYVRVYTRDTTEWSMLSWEARALFVEVLRKVDRAGTLNMGRHGLRGLAALIRYPAQVVERAMPELLDDGCIVIEGSALTVPNYVIAQEAKKSDAARKREQRERDVVAASLPAPEPGHQVTNRDTESQCVTESHERSRAVTPSHGRSRLVTPSLAEPSLAEPSHPPGGHRAREGAHAHESPPPHEEPVVDRDSKPEGRPEHPLDSEPTDAATPSGRPGALGTSNDDVDVGDESRRPEPDSVAARPVSSGTPQAPDRRRKERTGIAPDPATAAVLALLEGRRELRGIARLEAASRLAGFCREHGHQGKYSLADVLTCIEQAATKLGDREASTGIAPTQRDVGDVVFGFVKAGPKPPARASPGRGGAAIRQQGAAHDYPIEVLEDDDEGDPS